MIHSIKHKPSLCLFFVPNMLKVMLSFNLVAKRAERREFKQHDTTWMDPQNQFGSGCFYDSKPSFVTFSQQSNFHLSSIRRAIN